MNHWPSCSRAHSATNYASHDVSVRYLAVLLQAAYAQIFTEMHLPYASSYVFYPYEKVKEYGDSPTGDFHPIS